MSVQTIELEYRDRNPAASRTSKVAYVMSRFPKLTETFILFEMLALQQLGFKLEICPLQRELAQRMHFGAAGLVSRAHFTPWFAWRFLAAHTYFLRRSPGKYLGTLGTLLRANWGSSRYLAGAIVFFPKAVYLARHLATAQVDHVHAHFASHPAAVAYVIHRLTGIPYSFTAHGSDLYRDQHMLREKVACAKWVVAISKYNRRMILDLCGSEYADRVRVVHCGVDTERLQPHRDASRAEATVDRFRVACTGTLHEVKGQKYLVDACQVLVRCGVDLELHLIGDGPDHRRLRNRVDEAGLGDRVVFHGRCTQHEVRKTLGSVDLLAAPSVRSRCGRQEGIPVALMEAMACGVPVVASRLSGIPELVEHERTGLLVPPGDVVSLAEAIRRLLADTEMRERLALAGRAYVEQEYDLGTNAAELATLFTGSSQQ